MINNHKETHLFNVDAEQSSIDVGKVANNVTLIITGEHLND